MQGPQHAPGACRLRSWQLATEVLARGDGGPAVSELQQRLDDLKYWLGPVDGAFGELTEQAVYAFQKGDNIAVDGVVGTQTKASLSNPIAPTPRSSQGRVTEVDKASQLLYAVLDGRLRWVFHTSTGTELPYAHPGGYTALADTPSGTHTVTGRTTEGRTARLGLSTGPSTSTRTGSRCTDTMTFPTSPASHGCVRVTFAAIDYIWANGLMPMDSTVLVYGE